MIDSSAVSVFETFEAREAAFHELTGSTGLRRHLGTRDFFTDLKSSMLQGNKFVMDGRVRLCVTPNPRDWLAYRNVQEVIYTAALLAHEISKIDTDEIYSKAIEHFQLWDLLEVSVTRISYGEAAKVAMAKCYILSSSSSIFCISNPKGWLSQQSYNLLKILDAELQNNKIPRHFLMLQGEDDQSSPEIERDTANVNFELQIDSLKIDLGSIIDDEHEREFAIVEDFNSSFLSPLIVTGENGAGKSLIANALCGLGVLSGRASIQTSYRAGMSRMVFQDPIRQCLSRGFNQFKKYYKKDWAKIYQVYEKIIERSGDFATEFYGFSGTFGPINPLRETPTLFQVRALLAAVRIFELDYSAALILDEPAWGLSKQQAISLVIAIVGLSHEKKRPVIIITHNRWWGSVGKSWLSVEKTSTNSSDKVSLQKFSIKVSESHGV